MMEDRKDKTITLDANKMFRPFLKECLRVCMANLSIDVLKAQKAPSEFILNSLYHTAIDTSILFKSLMGIEIVNTKLLIKSLSVVSKFSKEVSFVKSSILSAKHGYVSDDNQFEFYKIATNAERMIDILKDNFDKGKSTISISENNLFMRSMATIKDKDYKYGSYFIDTEDMVFDTEADKVEFFLGAPLSAVRSISVKTEIILLSL